MARESRSNAVIRDRWVRLLPPLVANAADIPHLETPRLRLELITTEVGHLLTEQAALAASRQEVSKRLQALITEGLQLAAFLRLGIKQRYGTRSEKLTAFHLQPFRGRKAANQEEPIKEKHAADEPAVSNSAASE